MVDFSEALDSQPETLSGGPIDVTKLPRDGALGCTPVYPQKCARRLSLRRVRFRVTWLKPTLTLTLWLVAMHCRISRADG